jgi:hypothetical protein
MIRKYDGFADKLPHEIYLGDALKTEILDIMENDSGDDAAESIMNLVYDTKYEW